MGFQNENDLFVESRPGQVIQDATIPTELRKQDFSGFEGPKSVI